MRTILAALAAIFFTGCVLGSRPLRSPPGTAQGRVLIACGDATLGGCADVGPGPSWLDTLNRYRASENLAPVTEDRALSLNAAAHARYLVRNDRARIRAGRGGAELESEDPRRPGFSAAGLRSAHDSDTEAMAGPKSLSALAPGSIDYFIDLPFHRLSILSPLLRQTGYGEHCAGGVCAAALDTESAADPLPAEDPLFAAPIEFPPAGSLVRMRLLEAEWPQTLSACAGYAMPSGLPLTIQVGLNAEARLTDYSVTESAGGAPQVRIAACGYDSSSYVNSNRAQQKLVRDILTGYGAVVIIPRRPLLEGARYTVRATVNGKPYRWSFKVGRF